MSGDLFNETLSEQPTPQTNEEWVNLQINAADVFSPHAPIDNEALFAGRSAVIHQLTETIFQRGRHAILYGERGVGKTSLTNIIKDKIFGTKTDIKIIKRNCTNKHNFRLMWVHALDDYTIEGKTSDEFLGKDPNPYDIVKILKLLGQNERPVIIFDEFDRMVDEDAAVLMADTIKYFSDVGANVTIIIVGVAESVSELFGGHPSIQRNVVQIKMPRMDPEELHLILDNRLKDLGMEAEPVIKERIVEFSQGLPAYTHLLGQQCAISATQRKSMLLDAYDLREAVVKCVEQADETVKDCYLRATRSTKPNHQYKHALLACSLAKSDERGYFNAGDVREPFSDIMGREMKIPNFSRHLKEFCEDHRGPALVREGSAKSYTYRFHDPLLRPYVILSGIATGLYKT